jgi:uncharacterized membrane protein
LKLLFICKASIVIGLLLFFGHNLFDYLKLPPTSAFNTFATVLFTSRGAVFPLTSSHAVGAFYAILPWTGVMFLGYSLGPIFSKDYAWERRRKVLLALGSALIMLFVLLRLLRDYGDPGVWKPGEHSLFSFLNTSKYPPSLQYCCMTLGPGLLLMALFEKIHPAWTKIVAVYGRVPFFYYILHLYLLHIVLAILFFVSGHSTSQIFDPQSIFAFRPVQFGYSLIVVYIIWLAVVALLYLPSRWFNRYKMTHQNWWLSYL